jgi:hypothetical protein
VNLSGSLSEEKKENEEEKKKKKTYLLCRQHVPEG